MSQKSAAVPEDQSEGSILDFLYVDTQRIGTFLSQFNSFGDLTELVHGRNAGKAKVDESKLMASGGALIAKGEGSHSSRYSAQHNEESRRTYNPRWANTLAFLDEIDERGILKRDLGLAGIGDLVLVKGPLKVRDLSLLKKIWKMPAFRAFAEAGNQSDLAPVRRKGSSANQKKPPNPIDLIFELIEVLPHAVQAEIGGEQRVWFILREDGLMGEASDFSLKYGGSISGDWAVVGILDSHPNESPLCDEVIPSPNIENLADNLIAHLSPLTRQFLGRPSEAVGITPLALFRVVGS